MAGTDNPSAIEVQAAAFASLISRRQNVFPGVVTSVEVDGRVVVQPGIMIASRNGQQTPAKPVTIPIGWLSWGDVAIQGKLAPTDEVDVVCQDANWLSWLESGGVTPNLAPGGHQSGYAVAMPIQMSKVRRPPPLGPTDKIRVGTIDGLSTVVWGEDGSISVQSSQVRLGAAASPTLAVGRNTDPVDTNAAFTTWRTAVEVGVAAGGGGVVPPLAGTTIGTLTATSGEVESA